MSCLREEAGESTSSSACSEVDTIFNPSYRRQKEDERFALSGTDYLRRFNVSEYMSDAIRLLAESNDRNPLEFLASYFNNVLSGDNVLFRSFSYVRSTARNRRSFIRQLRDTHKNFDQYRDVSVQGLHQLMCLLCPDFPLQYVHAAARTFPPAPDSAGNTQQQQYPFGELSLRTHMFFFFAEFLGESAKLFRRLDTDMSAHVSRAPFSTALTNMIEARHHEFSCPKARDVEALLKDTSDSFTFEEFCRALCACENVQRLLLQPQTYSDLRSSIDKLLTTFDLASDSSANTRSKRRSRGTSKST